MHTHVHILLKIVTNFNCLYVWWPLPRTKETCKRRIRSFDVRIWKCALRARISLFFFSSVRQSFCIFERQISYQNSKNPKKPPLSEWVYEWARFFAQRYRREGNESLTITSNFLGIWVCQKSKECVWQSFFGPLISTILQQCPTWNS